MTMPPHDPDMDDVIAQARAGDVAAFNILVERYQRAAYSVALRLIGEPEAAADVTQDAIIAAFKAMRQFRGGAFHVWLLRIVTNHCFDYWRARKRRPTVSLDALTDPAPDGSAPGNDFWLTTDAWDPVALAEQHELQALLQRGLLTLQDDQRVALVLSDVEGLSYDEIAEVTQANLGTVKSRIARGRARLRDFLTQHRELLPRDYRPTPRPDPPPTSDRAQQSRKK